jgi:hypothetical protein
MTKQKIQIPENTLLFNYVKSGILSTNLLQQAVNRVYDGYGEAIGNGLTFGTSSDAPIRFNTRGVTLKDLQQVIPDLSDDVTELPDIIGLTWDDLELRPMLKDVVLAYGRQQRDFKLIDQILNLDDVNVSFEVVDYQVWLNADTDKTINVQ